MLEYFICHASEDKDQVARPLAAALTTRSLQVWYDEFSLTMGDSLRRCIDNGLSKCDFAIVVLSPAFFRKQWPQRELDGLTVRELDENRKIILPIWHSVSPKDVREFSAPLADKLAISTDKGIGAVCDAIIAASQQHVEIKAMKEQLQSLYVKYHDCVNRDGYDDGYGVQPSYEIEIKICRRQIDELKEKLSPYVPNFKPNVK